MSRSALYREYRPQDLSDVVGQEHITGLLETALSRQKLTHAYLFTGPRGTGKTSVARILARRVNELSTKTELESELDIIEIDAASNRGIDEIRALRDKVATAPSRLKYKIFIIDEAHMLTREAFNALLKTLEEPPAHAIFILATTEVHKLPDTVISRTQRYDFRPVRPSGMLSHLRMVAEAESMRIDDGALEAIAELSGGGFRDALSLLDQLGATDGQITRQLVTKLVGIGDEVAVGELILLTGQGRCDDALDLLSKLWGQGAEPTLLNEYILLLARKQFIEHSSKSGLSKAQLAKLLDSFLRASRELKTSPIPTLPLELAVWRLSKDADHEPISSAQPGTIRHQPEPSSGSNKQSKATSTAKLPQEVLGEEKITAKALSLIKSKNNSLYAVLRSGSPALQGDKLLLRCRFRFHKERIEEPKNQQFIETVFSKVAGRQIEMMVAHAGAENTTTESKSPEDELVASALEILGGEVIHE